MSLTDEVERIFSSFCQAVRLESPPSVNQSAPQPSTHPNTIAMKTGTLRIRVPRVYASRCRGPYYIKFTPVFNACVVAKQHFTPAKLPASALASRRGFGLDRNWVQNRNLADMTERRAVRPVGVLPITPKLELVCAPVAKLYVRDV